MISGLPSLRVRRALAAVAPLVVVLWLSGCESERYPKDMVYPLRTDVIVTKTPKSAPPLYPPGPGHLDEEIASIPWEDADKPIDPKAVAAPVRGQLQAALTNVFGTPRLPRVGKTKEEEAEVVGQLKDLKIRDDNADAPFKTLAVGSKVYRYHCVHCHGLAGDGRGPTGPWVVPHPRDYRSGEFKFTSSKNAGENTRPRREDLLRTLHNGIEGTSMPSFALLEVKDKDLERDDVNHLEAVASYVMHLSVRGLVEKRLLKAAVEEDLKFANQEEADARVHDAMKDVVGEWAAAGAAPIVPAKEAYAENQTKKDREDSIRRGYALFADPKGAASCIGCHLDFGRQAILRYDDWGTLVRPANLTAGAYRGGRRPIDLFWRVRGGIVPSGMPSNKELADKDVWDVVNFVQAMPYPQMLPEDVRFKVYDRPPSADHAGAEHAEVHAVK